MSVLLLKQSTGQSKSHLHTVFGYKVMNCCDVYFLMYFFVIYFISLPVSQFHIADFGLHGPYHVTFQLIFCVVTQYKVCKNTVEIYFVLFCNCKIIYIYKPYSIYVLRCYKYKDENKSWSLRMRMIPKISKCIAVCICDQYYVFAWVPYSSNACAVM